MDKIHTDHNMKTPGNKAVVYYNTVEKAAGEDK